MRNSILLLLIMLFGGALSAATTPTANTANCPCTGGYAQLQLLYLGENNAQADFYQDAEFSELMLSIGEVNNGDVLTLNAADAAGLEEGVFPHRTYVRVTVGDEVRTVDFYSTCPSVAFTQPLEEHLILGKTYGDFTVVAHTDSTGTVCSIEDADAGLAWQVGGNIVGAANNQLGTLNDEALTFMTDGKIRGIVTNDGRFGFNTTSPSAMVDVTGSFNATGNSTIGGSLEVDGNTSLASDLNVGGNSELTGNLGVAGNTALDGHISVAGNSTLSGDLEVTGDGALTGDFEVSGNTTLSGSDNNGVTSTLHLRSSGDQSMLLDGNEIDAMGGSLFMQNNTSNNIILANGGGNVGLGINPLTRLHVDGTMRLQNSGSGSFDLAVDAGGDLNFLGDGGQNFMEISDTDGDVTLRDIDGNAVMSFVTRDIVGQVGSCISLRGGSPLSSTISIDANWAGSGRGRIQTDEIQIMGGADISENFAVDASEATEAVRPGMLVCIDEDQPGQLQVSRQAADKKVVGVVSGANGVNTGLFMGQKGSIADGEHPIALMGRVYVLADASYGKIEPGDLLTSSPVPGHAMKVKKAKKAQGAIVGKAMSTLEKGQGYVLVLISLQ